MINKFLKFLKIQSRGFSLLELLVSVALFSIILMALFIFLAAMSSSNAKTKAMRETSENTRKVLERINHEIRSAKNIYTPTTSSGQLSLETTKYLLDGESSAFIDIFVCGDAICLKKESQDPVFLTSDSVKVTSLSFLQIAVGQKKSVQTSLTLSYKNSNNYLGSESSVSLTSTAFLRSY